MTGPRIGWIDLSARGRLEVRGADRVRFLQGMLTSDIAALGVGQSARAAMLTPKGRVVADLLVRAEPDGLLLDTDPELRQSLREGLERFIVMDDVTLKDVTEESAEIGLYGPGAQAALAALPESGTLRTLVAPLGLHAIGARDELAHLCEALEQDAGVRRLDAAAVERLRIERGVTRFGPEISEEVLPLEAGLDEALSLTKGCYIGQEPVARVSARGHVNKKVVGFTCKALPSRGDKVSTPDRPDAGTITSATFSEEVGAPIALGYLHRSLWAPGTPVRIGAAIEAQVAELPFMKW